MKYNDKPTIKRLNGNIFFITFLLIEIVIENSQKTRSLKSKIRVD